MKILVVYYSSYGHTHRMAEAVAEGAGSVKKIEVKLLRVPETLPEKILKETGAFDAQKKIGFFDVEEATIDELASADGMIFGTPTRFGNMCAQMRAFMDSTGPLWASGALVGKPAGVFTSSQTQHGGQESTILSFHITLLHLGMVIVGLPYSFQGQMKDDEITGCSPYGASTIAGGDGKRIPSDNELEGARFQGEHLAQITLKLRG